MNPANSFRKVIVFNIILFVVLVAAAITGYYFYNQSTLYLKTDDAQISGTQITVAAPATGKLINWQGNVGTNFTSGQQVAEVQTQEGNKVVDIPVTMPAAGTIAQDDAVNNQIVAAGTPLAYAYDMRHLYVVAKIKETLIDKDKVGQQVDVYVAGKAGSINGTVTQIGDATAGTFSLLPTQSTTADYTPVTQVVPVTISLGTTAGSGLVPGMSATVRIHK
ncbi:multidrug transporter [Alicyclobacillus tengchongensis]|nr:multidrug transporter [Alicyclobacillus tengchongensis]